MASSEEAGAPIYPSSKHYAAANERALNLGQREQKDRQLTYRVCCKISAAVPSLSKSLARTPACAKSTGSKPRTPSRESRCSDSTIVHPGKRRHALLPMRPLPTPRRRRRSEAETSYQTALPALPTARCRQRPALETWSFRASRLAACALPIGRIPLRLWVTVHN